MQEHVGLHRARHRHRDAGDELGLGEPADRGLMAGVVAHARLGEQRVAHLDVAVEEHPLPRDQHVVEHADRIGLLEARAERMVPHALRAAVERLAADEAQARRRARDAERQHVALLAVAQAGLWIDQQLVGGRAVGGEHLGAAHDQAVLGLLDHAEMREFVPPARASPWSGRSAD